ncbi:hypothetical protein N0V90_007050 [Kalmusia sp. IMI 367209]|nr:hypothetical protein N0V90_007050 [Kalmusia sp. IMI 367209]
MSEKKSNWGREKRKQVQSDDGWTVVAGGRTKASNEGDKLQNARPTRIVGGLTAEKLLGELEVMERKWDKSSCAQNLNRILHLRDWTVKEAQSDSSLTLYAQEPAFTPLDTAFLSRLDVTTLPSSIETHITSTSFVFAPFVDWYLLLPQFLKQKEPDLYIGNEILSSYGPFANTNEKIDVLEECNELGKSFLEGRERRRVPEFEEHGSALEGLMIYWKEHDDE